MTRILGFRVTEFGLSWGGIGCRGEDFGVVVGRLLGFRRESSGLCLGGFWLSWGRRLSGLRGEDLGFVGIRAFVGGFRAFVARDSGWGGFRAFVARLSGFRREGFWFWWEAFWGRVSGCGGRILGLGRIWGFVGVRAFVGRNSGFRIDFMRLRAAPLKRIDFANRIDFTRLDVRAAPLKKELSWAPSCVGEP